MILSFNLFYNLLTNVEMGCIWLGYNLYNPTEIHKEHPLITPLQSPAQYLNHCGVTRTFCSGWEGQPGAGPSQ